jgi:hypothetical protein
MFIGCDNPCFRAMSLSTLAYKVAPYRKAFIGKGSYVSVVNSYPTVLHLNEPRAMFSRPLKPALVRS